jgi:hypothetical protein
MKEVTINLRASARVHYVSGALRNIICRWQEHHSHAFCQTPARTLSQRGLAVQAGQTLTFDAFDPNEVLLRVFCRFGQAAAP